MKKTVPIVDAVDVRKFLRYLRDWNRNYYIAAAIGIQWGLRCSDILALRVGDVVAGKGARVQIVDRLTVKEIKTGHERHIRITEEMKDALREHVKKIKSPVNMSAPLILSRNKLDGNLKPLSRYRLWRVISYAARALDIKGPIGTHSLRKTFAHQAWQSGARVDEIQKEFGHASADTTHRYANIPDERREALYQKINFLPPGRRREDKKTTCVLWD
jgi:integrase